jgi:hypothetical protein
MAQPESRLSRKIAAEFRARGGFVFKVHGGPTMMAGLPDLPGCYRGRSVWFETKMPGNKPTPIQLLRHRQIRAAGGIVAVPRSVAEAMAVLDAIDASMDN